MRKFHAHCVCVVGKNYRLQDIQLSKNLHLRPLGFGETGPRAANAVEKSGGEYRARTGDLLVANQALSQLS